MSELKVDYFAVRRLMKSDEFVAAMKAEAESRAARMGKGYEAEAYKGSVRANGFVLTRDPAVIQRNYASNEMLKAFYAAGVKPPSSVAAGNTGTQVKSYTRRLKSGKVITVKAYRRKK